MKENKLTQEMKRHAVIVATHVKYSDFEISHSCNVERLFVHKPLMAMWKVLPNAENINLVQIQLEHHSL